LPNRETTIGQNTQLSEKICSCFSLRPWPSPRLIRLSPRLIRPLADSGGIFARDICMVFALLLSICANQRKSAVKYPVFVRDREGFCLSTLPTNKKRSSLRPLRLCGELIFFCVNLRESAIRLVLNERLFHPVQLLAVVETTARSSRYSMGSFSFRTGG